MLDRFKKHIFVVVCVLLNYTCSFAQKLNTGFAVKGGYSLSAQSPILFGEIDYYRFDVNFFYLGVEYQKKIGKNSAISFGLDFTKKGYRNDVIFVMNDAANTVIHFKWNYDLYYAEAPLLLKNSIGTFMTVSYGLVPAFTFYNRNNFYHKLTSTTQNSESSYSKTWDYKNVRGYDLQLCLGLSRYVTKGFTVEAQFRRGLFNQNLLALGDIGFQNLFMFGIKYTFTSKTNANDNKNTKTIGN